MIFCSSLEVTFLPSLTVCRSASSSFVCMSFTCTSRLEQKIKDLESQFDDEQRRLVEAEKSHRRTSRRIKELTFSQEEDHKVTILNHLTIIL